MTKFNEIALAVETFSEILVQVGVIPTKIFGVHFRALDVYLDANRIPSKYSSSAIINHMEVSSVPAKTKDEHDDASFSNPSQMVQFPEHSNRWVSFTEHRWVIFGER